MLPDVMRVVRFELLKLRWWGTGWKLLALLLVGTQLSLCGHRISAVELAARPLRVAAPTDGFSADGAIGAMISCDTRADRSASAQAVAAGTDPAADACARLRAARTSALQIEIASLYPQGAAIDAVRFAALGGLLLAAILFSMMAGMEFGHGTIRPALSRGLNRVAFLFGKQLAGLAAVTFALGTAVGLAIVTCGLYRVGVDTSALDVGRVPWATVGAGVLRALGGMFVFGCFAMAIAVASRSVAIATSVSMLAFICELALVATVRDAGARVEFLVTHLPVCTIQRFVDAGGPSSHAICRSVPDALPAWIPLVAFGAVAQLSMICILVVRDVTSARGD
ncbi:MAG: hypothetical protein MUD17_05970 [Gemmatimonadaceae bacterium]|jgi:hypothetical protein|nr:hypothetical protein [Gemmatimonadaceae bacterium]